MALPDTHHIRELLIREADTLRSEILALQPSLSVPKQADPGDEFQSRLEQEAALRVTESNARLLSRVLSAIEAIDDGVYGACADCGRPIPEKRLRAVPWATTCINCAERHERGAMHRPTSDLGGYSGRRHDSSVA